MDKLFSDFPKVSKEKWEEKLIKELKGADFESSLKRIDDIEDFAIGWNAICFSREPVI